MRNVLRGGLLFLVALLLMTTAYGQVATTTNRTGDYVIGAGTGGGYLAGSAAGWPMQGRVIMEDDSAPSESVIIESVCGGVSHQETKTDKKGAFYFRMGDNSNRSVSSAASGTTIAAGANAVSDTSPLGDCEIRAVLTGYRSDRIALTNLRSGDDTNIGTIVLHRMGEEEGSLESVASAKAPDDAKKAFGKAENAVKNKKYDEALADYEKAVEIYPDYAEAWFQIGRIQLMKNDDESARKSFESAVKADKKFIPPYLQIMSLDVKASDIKALAKSSEKVIRLDPVSYPVAYLYNSIAEINLKNVDAAEKSAREGLKLDAKHSYPKFCQVLGAILADRGEFASAAEQYRLYLQYAPNAADAAVMCAQLDEFEKLSTNSGKKDSTAKQ